MYKEGLNNSNVLVLSDGYFLPAQTWSKNGLISILPLKVNHDGLVTLVDTFTTENHHTYPGLAGSVLQIGQSIYNAGILEGSSMNILGALFKIDGFEYQELNRYKFQDTIVTLFNSSSITADQKIQVVGYVFKYTGGQNVYQSQLLLMQLDTAGNKLWERSYPAKAGLWHLEGNGIITTQDGGFAVAGNAYNYAVFPSYTSCVMLTDSLGNKLKERYLKYENFGNYSMGLQQKQNGNFIVAYATTYKVVQGSEHLSRKLIIEELDKDDLTTVWKKEYLSGYLNGLVVNRLIPQNDSTYLIAGNYWPDPILYPGTYARQLGYIFAITANGDSLWYRDYVNATDPDESNYLNDIAITPDGGIVGAGDLLTPKSPLTGGLAYHVWLFKTDSIGCLYAGCDTVYEKAKPPVTEFKVYPNPAQYGQDLIIELPNAKSAKATLYNTIGQVVFQKEIEFVSGVSSLSLGEGWGGVNLRSGIFYLNLQTPSGKTYVEKIVLY